MKPAAVPAAQSPQPALYSGGFDLRPAERRLFLHGRELTLGSRAFSLLCELVARRGQVVSKEELMDAVWPGLVVEENNLQVQISTLRKALGPQTIATLPGLGYRFTMAADGAADTPAGTIRDARVTAPQTAPWPGAPAPPRQAAASARILVVEDNRVTRLLLARTLELMGHRVALADNGLTALSVLREHRHDLLLLDLELPGLGGIALLEALNHSVLMLDTPVIVTSALDDVQTVARCIELGADDYLHKPVNPVLLKARLEASLARKALRDLQYGGRAALKPDDAPALPVAAEMTVLAARLCGLGSATAASGADRVLELLADWCILMFDAVRECGGTVRQCHGDLLLATFSAPGPTAAAGAAAQAARDMMAMVKQLELEHAAVGSVNAAATPISLQVGIASGSVLVGRVGPAPGAVCACMGAAVDDALRQAMSIAGGGP